MKKIEFSTFSSILYEELKIVLAKPCSRSVSAVSFNSSGLKPALQVPSDGEKKGERKKSQCC